MSFLDCFGQQGKGYSSYLDLYKVACTFDYTTCLYMARQAETEEERNFYMFIGDMNLQREQRKVIDKE